MLCGCGHNIYYVGEYLVPCSEHGTRNEEENEEGAKKRPCKETWRAAFSTLVSESNTTKPPYNVQGNMPHVCIPSGLALVLCMRTWIRPKQQSNLLSWCFSSVLKASTSPRMKHIV